MTPRETKKSTHHQPATRSHKPFFNAGADRVFFATENAQSTPFFTSENLKQQQATPVVQRMPAFESEVNLNKAALVQRQADMGSELPDKEPVQRQAQEEEKPMQTKADGNQAAKVTSSKVQQTNSTNMPDHLKAGIENLSGISMDDVKIHYNSAKPAQVQALAYTQGTDIHVAPGQEKHLPHEAWHVVQQKQGRVKATLQTKGVAINDDVGLEREADVMGDRAVDFGTKNQSYSTDENAKAQAKILQRRNQTGKVIQLKWNVHSDYIQIIQVDPLKALLTWARSEAPVKALLEQVEQRIQIVMKDMRSQEILNKIQNSLLETASNPEIVYGVEHLLTFTDNELVQHLMSSPDELAADADHKDENTVAQEEPVDIENDLLLGEFSPEDEGLKNIFFQLAYIKGYYQLPMKAYYEWYNSGVVTRQGFDNLLLKYSQGNNQLMQMRRLPGAVSYQHEYTTNNFGKFKDITYTTDSKANIDFSSPTDTKKWKNPVDSKIIELSKGLKDKEYGLMRSGNKVKIKNASRSQHFSIANRIMGYDFDGSPDDWTWHHLTPRYKMVLVDREVHRKHGHNGGMYIW